MRAVSMLAIALAAPAWAQQSLLAERSEIAFTSRQMGVPVAGTFKRFSGSIRFDPRQPDGGRVALQIDLGSVAIGDASTRAELAAPVWFDSDRVPRATFESTRIEAAGAGSFEVVGRLSIRGQQRELRVPVSLTQAGAVSTASGAFLIRRLDFRIGDGPWADTALVANDVQVRFRFALSGVGPL